MTFSDSPSGSENRISVLVVDDHQVVRQGLRTFLELQPDIRVVGEAGDGETAVELVRQLQPDVVLMDLVMPQLDGIAATRQVKALGGQTKVIALTSFTEDDKVFPAIQAGASSYLLKDVSPDELVEAIRAAHRGEARLHPNVARKLMEQVQSSAPFVRQAHHSLPEELTGRGPPRAHAASPLEVRSGGKCRPPPSRRRAGPPPSRDGTCRRNRG